MTITADFAKRASERVADGIDTMTQLRANLKETKARIKKIYKQHEADAGRVIEALEKRAEKVYDDLDEDDLHDRGMSESQIEAEVNRISNIRDKINDLGGDIEELSLGMEIDEAMESLEEEISNSLERLRDLDSALSKIARTGAKLDV